MMKLSKQAGIFCLFYLLSLGGYAQIAEMVLVKGGTFKMGSKDTLFIDETPQHQVKVNDFYIGKYEVTVGEWEAFCKATEKAMPEKPEWGWQKENPIVNINWFEAIEYCNWRSKQESKTPCYVIDSNRVNIKCNFNANGYRLLTEAGVGICSQWGTEK